MRHSTLRWGVAAVAAALLVPLAQFAAAEGRNAPPAGGSKGSAAPSNFGSGAKILFTVPEDGFGEETFPASSMLVRDIVAARPDEDLVICIAGCRPGQDRIIFAQPFDPLRKTKSAAVNPAAVDPGADMAAAGDGEAQGDEPNPAMSDKPAGAAAATPKSQAQGTAQLPALMGPAFEHVMNLPAGGVPSQGKLVPASAEQP